MRRGSRVSMSDVSMGGAWLGLGVAALVALSLSDTEAGEDRMVSSYTCGDSTMAREFHFVSPGYPVSIGHDSLDCSLSIDHGCARAGGLDSLGGDEAVCQVSRTPACLSESQPLNS